MTNKRLIIIGVILICLIGAALYKLYYKPQSGITATGTIEVTLADVVPKVNGYINELKIEVGDSVKAGQLVAHIKRLDLEAQIKADEAALAKAKSQLIDLEKGSRSQEIEQATANIGVVQAQYIKAKNDLERYSKLYQDGAISAQQLDLAQSSYNVAYSTLAGYQAKESLLIEGNRIDQIEAQRAEVKRLEAVLALDKSTLVDTDIASPLNGIVLSKNYQKGEYASVGSAIATIGDLNDCWIKVYVSSDQLGLIKFGQAVDVKIDAYPERVFSGTIKEISQKAEFTPRQSITQRERANMVYYVKVKIDNSEGILKPGMPADVVIK